MFPSLQEHVLGVQREQLRDYRLAERRVIKRFGGFKSAVMAVRRASVATKAMMRRASVVRRGSAVHPGGPGRQVGFVPGTLGGHNTEVDDRDTEMDMPRPSTYPDAEDSVRVHDVPTPR